MTAREVRHPLGADDALDALEMMVEQFFRPMPDGSLRHSFMSCEEYAAEVLCALRPERWESVGRSGIRLKAVGFAPPQQPPAVVR